MGILSKAVMGGILGAGAQGVYNTSNGEPGGKNMFRSIAMGAATFGGYHAMKNPGTIKNLGMVKEGTRLGKNIKDSSMFGKAGQFTKDAGKTAESAFRRTEMFNKAPKGGFVKSATNLMSSSVSGGVIGAGAGAVYGGFSSNESIVSGASKGLMIGAMAGAAKSSFSKLNRNIAGSSKISTPGLNKAEATMAATVERNRKVQEMGRTGSTAKRKAYASRMNTNRTLPNRGPGSRGSFTG